MSGALMKEDTKLELLGFLEEEIDSAAQKIVKLKDRQDHFAYGQIQALMIFRRLLSDSVTDKLVEPSPRRTDMDRGFLSALDKILARLGLLQPKCLAQKFETQLTAEQKRVAASPHLAADTVQRVIGEQVQLATASDLDRSPPTASSPKVVQPKPQPVKQELKAFIEDQINNAAKKIADKKSLDFDHFANGQLGYLLALRRWIEGISTREDLGLHDALNDVLQKTAYLRLSSSNYLKDML